MYKKLNDIFREVALKKKVGLVSDIFPNFLFFQKITKSNHPHQNKKENLLPKIQALAFRSKFDIISEIMLISTNILRIPSVFLLFLPHNGN